MTLLHPILWLLLLPLASTLDPRRFLPYDSDNTHSFHEEGVLDYSTMLLREDLDLLVVGASGMLYALHLNDISKKNDSVKWDVTPQQALKCEGQTSHAADWKSCLFFAVFTSQTWPTVVLAVCVYSVTDISREFSEGQFMTRVFDEWTPHNGPLPVPRPGSCIDNATRKAGIEKSLVLPDQTIDFMLRNPIMDEDILPVGQKALLVKERGEFTRIIVDQVQTTDGDSHHVMFIGTMKGTILKAVNYDGEMFIIQEVQVFKTPEPIKILKFSSVRRQIYAGSDSGVVQVSASSCGRSLSCVDCVLARDPYCGWDQAAGRCTALSATPSHHLLHVILTNMVSSSPFLKVQTEKKSLAAAGYLKLLCSSESKLATVRWEKDHSPLGSSPHHLELEDGLLILNASKSDAGLYRCLSVERSRVEEYTTVIAQYDVTMEEEAREALVQLYNYPVLAQQIGLVLVGLASFGILIWNIYKGHLRFLCKYSRLRADVAQRSQTELSNIEPETRENEGDSI
ncbi:semaphorin-4E-like [Neosynchiropus ocellatus]